MRDHGGADRQRSLQSSLSQNEERERHAGLGPCARDRKSDGARTTSHETIAGAGDQRSIRLQQRDGGQSLNEPGQGNRTHPEDTKRKRIWRWPPRPFLARQRIRDPPRALGKQFEMELPQGASAIVDAAAKEFIAKFGVENLPV